jgi:hypothetical protein
VAERRRIEEKGKALINDQRSYNTLSHRPPGVDRTALRPIERAVTAHRWHRRIDVPLMEEPGGNDAAHDPFALMLGLALATTAHAKPEGQVKFDANAPVAEQIRNVETAINSEDYSEIGLEDKSRVQQALSPQDQDGRPRTRGQVSPRPHRRSSTTRK